MSCLHYVDKNLYIEAVSLKSIAEAYGTPTYVYSRKALESNWHAFDHAFNFLPHRICYAVKANCNIAILNLLANLNSGFDIVSGGELERVIKAGGDPKKIVFSGVGKKINEIEQAIQKGIYCFDIESEAELERVATIAAKLNTIVNIALRVNPDIDPKTHSHISTGLKENKFGIEINRIIPLTRKIASFPSLKLIGIACHIGSQIIDLNPFANALDCLTKLYEQLRAIGFSIQYINIGGGLGITYHNEHPPTIQEYAAMVREKLSSYPIELIVEPGRSIIGNAGVLLTQVEYLKETSQKNFAIVDAGMNDLLRPALYNAWQTILPIELRHPQEKKTYDVAGPVCESADFLGKNRDFAIHPGDFLAVDSAGAYGFCMSSNYNSRSRPAEIIVDGNRMHLIRQRETIAETMALEQIIME